MSDFTADDERFGVVFDAVGKSSFAACRRLLVPGGVYMSTELGPRGQNPLLAIADRLGKLVGARRVLFPIPTRTQDDLVVSIAHRRVEVATLRAAGPWPPRWPLSAPTAQIAHRARKHSNEF